VTGGLSMNTRGENLGQVNLVLKDRSDAENEARVAEALRARFATIPDLEVKFGRPSYFSLKTPVEVDLYGEGQREGQPVAVVGEVRSRIYGRDVEGAVRQADRLAPRLPGAPVVVLFGFVIHPSAREAASRLGAIVISSSGRG